jgi:UDP-2,3-diacylglucosamine hydrolase
MKIVFIADGHLKGLTDPSQARLAEFLKSVDGVDILVILGDLFDFWTGFTDVVYYHYLPVLNALKDLKDSGTRIIYLEGNHDFTMGEFFTGVLEAGVYPDFFELDADGKRFYLAHGDTIKMGVRHALWRGFLRTPLFRLITKLATPGFVWRVAGVLSKKSRGYNMGGERGEGGLLIERRLREFARQKIATGIDAVVFGHSHVSGVYDEVVEGMRGVYANPGSWTDGASYLVYEGGAFRVERYTG